MHTWYSYFLWNGLSFFLSQTTLSQAKITKPILLSRSIYEENARKCFRRKIHHQIFHENNISTIYPFKKPILSQEIETTHPQYFWRLCVCVFSAVSLWHCLVPHISTSHIRKNHHCRKILETCETFLNIIYDKTKMDKERPIDKKLWRGDKAICGTLCVCQVSSSYWYLQRYFNRITNKSIPATKLLKEFYIVSKISK